MVLINNLNMIFNCTCLKLISVDIMKIYIDIYFFGNALTLEQFFVWSAPENNLNTLLSLLDKLIHCY